MQMRKYESDQHMTFGVGLLLLAWTFALRLCATDLHLMDQMGNFASITSI